MRFRSFILPTLALWLCHLPLTAQEDERPETTIKEQIEVTDGAIAKVVQVDVSRPALERAARSEALNGVETERVRHDVFAWLATAAKRGELWSPIA